MKLALSLLLAALSLASAAGQVGPVPGTQRIIPVYDQADVVCLCRIESVVITPGQPAADFAESKIVQRGVAMTVEAKQIFKSDRPNAQQFLVKYTEEVGVTSPPKTILERGDIALLFLKAISPTTYQLGDRFLGVTRFTALPGAAGTKGLGGLETCLVSLVRHENKDDRLNGLRLLQGFDSLSQSSIAEVNTLANSEDPEIAFTALAVLLKTKTPSAVEKLKNYVENYKGNAEPISLVSIGTELAAIRDEKCLSMIEALASSKYRPVRYGAVQGLRKMRNTQSVPTIVLRLDDPDRAIQYLAVITLAEILGKYEGDYAPSMYLFDKKTQYYVGLWKQWWTDEGSKLYARTSVPK